MKIKPTHAHYRLGRCQALQLGQLSSTYCSLSSPQTVGNPSQQGGFPAKGSPERVQIVTFHEATSRSASLHLQLLPLHRQNILPPERAARGKRVQANADIIRPQHLTLVLEDTKPCRVSVEIGNSTCPTGCCFMDVKAAQAFSGFYSWYGGAFVFT